MEKIRQYYKISDIKPKYHELVMPYYKTSPSRIDINLDELELYYNKHLDMFKKFSVTGGAEIGKRDEIGSDKITVLNFPLD